MKLTSKSKKHQPANYSFVVLNLLLIIINKIKPVTPATSKPVSSKNVKVNAAVKPIILHSRGIINKCTGILLFVKSNIPNVKIVVGQGKPNVGE